MPLYFPVSCTSPFLFHIGTIRPILHSFCAVPSCIHTFSSLRVHLTPTSLAISTISSRTSSAPVALHFSPCAWLIPFLPVLSPPRTPLSQLRLGARGYLLLLFFQQLFEVCVHILNTSSLLSVMSLPLLSLITAPLFTVLSRAILNIIFLPPSSSNFRYSYSSILLRALSTTLLAAFFRPYVHGLEISITI